MTIPFRESGAEDLVTISKERWLRPAIKQANKRDRRKREAIFMIMFESHTMSKWKFSILNFEPTADIVLAIQENALGPFESMNRMISSLFIGVKSASKRLIMSTTKEGKRQELGPVNSSYTASAVYHGFSGSAGAVPGFFVASTTARGVIPAVTRGSTDFHKWDMELFFWNYYHDFHHLRLQSILYALNILWTLLNLPPSASTAHHNHGTALKGAAKWWYPRGRELPKWSSEPPGCQRTMQTPGEVKQVTQLRDDRSAVYSDTGVVSIAVQLRKPLLTACWSRDCNFCVIDSMIQVRATERDGVDACESCARGGDWQRGVFVGCFAMPGLFDNCCANV